MRKTLHDFCMEQGDAALLQQWDVQANGAVTPHSISYGSRKKVWWHCKRDIVGRLLYIPERAMAPAVRTAREKGSHQARTVWLMYHRCLLHSGILRAMAD